MSKHIFVETINNQKYEIQIGWDKPTQEYYGMILGWIKDTDCEDGGYFDDLIWSNIYSPGRPFTCFLVKYGWQTQSILISVV